MWQTFERAVFVPLTANQANVVKSLAAFNSPMLFKFWIISRPSEGTNQTEV